MELNRLSLLYMQATESVNVSHVTVRAGQIRRVSVYVCAHLEIVIRRYIQTREANMLKLIGPRVIIFLYFEQIMYMS